MVFERRKSARLVFEVGASQTAELNDFDGTVIRSHILDISLGGVRLLVPEMKGVPNVMQAVERRITLPETVIGPFFARVVYARPESDAYRIGLSFFPAGTPAAHARFAELESWIKRWNSDTSA
jgi:hypothetical protein